MSTGRVGAGTSRCKGPILAGALVGMVLFPAVVRGEFRPVDSSGNHLTHSNWGSAGDQYIHIGPVGYEDQIASLAVGNAPNPRRVSNEVFYQPPPLSIRDPMLSELVWVWGQFIAHDIDHTSNQDLATGERIDMVIPDADPLFTPGQIIPATRAVYDPATGTDVSNPRRIINNLSAFIDATTVYGEGQARSDFLREFAGGRMKTSTGPSGDILLPRHGGDPAAPFMAGLSAPNMGDNAFVAGDVRGNEHVALTAMHTLFVREHNRLAAIIDATHADLPMGDPVARDEEIYQRARKIVGAEIQAITYNEYLPSMGVYLGGYGGYDGNVNPAIAAEFAAAAFRMGHSQTNNLQLRLNEDGSTIPQGHLLLGDMFFDPNLITHEGGIDPIIRGLAANAQEKFDPLIVEGLRSLLFGRLDPSGLIANGTDLGALDILRSRDFGVADYNTVRSAYHLTPATSFAEVTSDPDMQATLARLYGDVAHLDLFVGLLVEDLAPGESLSETARQIIAEQFIRLRDGDRFYFENDPDLDYWQAPVGDATHEDVLAWLKNLSLSEIITINTGVVSIQDNVFLLVPEPAGLAMLVVGGLGLILRRNR